ncbi:MAG TPA: hypothetical protein VND22_08885 [Actinomycetota bacterium]|nr:hypothetical protein [Actinomycetota bacterium]
MELDGHPTQDIVEELQRRGGLLYQGTDMGPDEEALTLPRHRSEHERGLWVFLPTAAYETEIDEMPPF